MNSEWFRTAARRDVVLRGFRISAVVGTALVAINQGDHILAGTLSATAVWKIPLTYLVPYLISTDASVAAIVSAASNDVPNAMPD
jgi:hypothetical protein